MFKRLTAQSKTKTKDKLKKKPTKTKQEKNTPPALILTTFQMEIICKNNDIDGRILR